MYDCFIRNNDQEINEILPDKYTVVLFKIMIKNEILPDKCTVGLLEKMIKK